MYQGFIKQFIDSGPGGRAVRHPYVAICGGLILAWLAAWLFAFHNMYGWLTDDAMTFYRIQIYEQGGRNLFDIQWFHAYMWFLVTIPWLFHWTIPSHIIPRAWSDTGQFRALILLTICLHALLLALVARFLRQLCANRTVSLGALILVMTSPTFLLYADLLDSRYMGFIFAMPGIILLLSATPKLDEPVALGQLLLKFTLPGLLVAMGEDTHYESLYLTVPISIAYWALVIAGAPRSLERWKRLAFYSIGLAAWIGGMQWLSLLYHPFPTSFIGTLLWQRGEHLSPYSRLTNWATWFWAFYDEMGLPMMLATACGAFVVASKRYRPDYISPFAAKLMLWTVVILSMYLLWSPTHPFYRMVSGVQIFYAIFSVVAIERLIRWLPSATSPQRFIAGAILYVAVGFIPSAVRGPEVFVAQQGLGRAVNLAYSLAGHNDVYFMATYDWDPNPKAILSRGDFDRLKPGDYIVTDYPIFYHVKYPDIFALLYDTKPVASFPTEWCTQETWAELRTYYWFRRWYDEKPNCEAQVFHVADIRREETGEALYVKSVRADSILSEEQMRDDFPKATVRRDGSLTNVDWQTSQDTQPTAAGDYITASAVISKGSASLESGLLIGSNANNYYLKSDRSGAYLVKYANGQGSIISRVAPFPGDTSAHMYELAVEFGAARNVVSGRVDSAQIGPVEDASGPAIGNPSGVQVRTGGRSGALRQFHIEGGTGLDPGAVEPSNDPSLVFALRNPRLPLDDNYFGRTIFDDMWVSGEENRPHWLEVTLAQPARIGMITIVPPDYLVPPDLLYTGRVRIDSMQIFGGTASGEMRLLWSGDRLWNKVIFNARFPATTVSMLRFQIEQHGPPNDNHAAALEYIRFPGYTVHLLGHAGDGLTPARAAVGAARSGR